MSGLTTSIEDPRVARIATALGELDERYHPAAGLRWQFDKGLPTHWSFMLGEVALCSFLVLLLYVTYLALFYDATGGSIPPIVRVVQPGSAAAWSTVSC